VALRPWLSLGVPLSSKRRYYWPSTRPESRAHGCLLGTSLAAGRGTSARRAGGQHRSRGGFLPGWVARNVQLQGSVCPLQRPEKRFRRRGSLGGIEPMAGERQTWGAEKLGRPRFSVHSACGAKRARSDTHRTAMVRGSACASSLPAKGRVKSPDPRRDVPSASGVQAHLTPREPSQRRLASSGLDVAAHYRGGLWTPHLLQTIPTTSAPGARSSSGSQARLLLVHINSQIRVNVTQPETNCSSPEPAGGGT
jgi:hypothetical protein